MLSFRRGVAGTGSEHSASINSGAAGSTVFSGRCDEDRMVYDYSDGASFVACKVK